MLLIVIVALPMALLMAGLITQHLRDEQARFESAMQNRAAGLSQAVDREIRASMSALNILVVSDTLQRDDLAGFFSAVAALPSAPGAWQGVFLIGPNDEVLLNTAQPQGKPLGVFADKALLDLVRRAPQPRLSNLVLAPDGQWRTSVLAPVLVKGRVRYVLGAWLAPSIWQRVLEDRAQSSGPHAGYTCLVEGHLRQLACERGGEAMPSHPLPDPLQTLLRRHPSGWVRGDALRASDNHAAWQAVGPFSWQVLVIEPVWPALIAQLGGAAELSIAGLLTLIVAVTLALKLVRREHAPSPARRHPASAAKAPLTKQPQPRVNQLPRELDERVLIEWAQSVGHIGFFNHAHGSPQVNWTPGLSLLLGLPQAACEGSWRQLLRRLNPQDRRRLVQQVKQALHEGIAQLTLEGRCLSGEPQPRWLSCRASFTYDTQRRAQSITGMVMDISPQKALDHERAALMVREQSARQEAERANRAKDEFLAMLGHELRNPLGAISAACEVLNRAAPQEEVAQRARQIIARQTSHLSRLMDDLLDVFRVISGKVLLVRAPMLLGQVVQRVAHTLELAGQLGAHELSLKIDEVWVHADITRMEQVITNLLSNAVKYTPAGGAIEVRVQKQDNHAVLQVRDSGVGMTSELMGHVFDMFVQGERAMDRPQGGLGIGLALVRRLTELHGGQVSVDSPGPGRGCTFTVRMPLAQALLAPVESSAEQGASAPRRVVVVEDNEDTREALCALLTLNHHDTYSATEGRSGLELIMQVQPDVALIDIGLPGLTGYDVARHLRSAGYGGRLIAVSGYGQPADVQRAHQAGFNQHLVKPVNPSLLEQLLMPMPHGAC
ncbi:hybrid sensor histidine kinase/response regulator [Aquabacterium sp. NJ1]|uniref:hybrid sensor histidine kinase/response regulator n=1 Tax=Aquabacterium sp. NJ1 TaxID=1538295 RepID=UPI00068A0571|nr:hybrid sensor histidine kinase/response regulator [Aquabacterium sp. NJ1]